MTTDYISKLLSESEGLTVEYKECTHVLSKSVWETVCAFSNRYGGYLILGVSDNGIPIGVDRNAAGQIKKDFANTLNNPQKIAPSLFFGI